MVAIHLSANLDEHSALISLIFNSDIMKLVRMLASLKIGVVICLTARL